MNIKDTIVYFSMIPMVFAIVAGLVFAAVLAATGVAGIVIFLAETLHG